jgi:hypothetical protein
MAADSIATLQGQVEMLRRELTIVVAQLKESRAEVHALQQALRLQQSSQMVVNQDAEHIPRQGSLHGHASPKVQDSQPAPEPIYRYIPPHSFLPLVFIQEYFDIIEIIDRYARLYYKHRPSPKHVIPEQASTGAGGFVPSGGSAGLPNPNQEKWNALALYKMELENQTNGSELALTRERNERLQCILRVWYRPPPQVRPKAPSESPVR